MSDDPRVQRLLDALADSRASPEEVCASCPELLPQVRERWREMCRAQAELDALLPMAERHTRPAPVQSGDMPLPVIPGYEVEKVLGLGGMGVVFRAKHLRLNRVIALKMALAGAYAPRERERFQREAEAVAALRHPNIVQIHDVGDSDGRPFFTMEYVDGGSLAQQLAGAPRPARDAASLVATLARAVHAAHKSGIVHRDLKPANVLVNADGTPKVSDFGLARRLTGEAGLTKTGTAVGTPSYMAPEQARGEPAAVGPAADIYALGAILYELLTGRPPFRAETAAETVLQVMHQDPVAPARLNPRVPRDLETICLKCLHKSWLRRYASAEALADDIARFLQGETIAARAEGPLARLARRIRRRPALSAALTAAALSALTLLGAGLWFLAQRSATAHAADQDLITMEERLQKRAWPEAKAALERATGRLTGAGSATRRRRLDQGTSDLELAARLDTIRLNGADDSHAAVKRYPQAFEAAGLGKIGDDPAVVALRIRQSNIKQALVDALDQWALWTDLIGDANELVWLLDVTRQADPDPQGWRDRFRDASVRKSREALAALADSANLDDTPVNLLVALGELWYERGGDATPFVMKVQEAHPDDLWVNFLLGHHTKNQVDAIRYYQAALAIRPGTPVLYYNLGYATYWASRRDEALAYFTKAVQLDPRRAAFRAGLGRCLMDLGRDREAVEQFQEGLTLSPDTGSLRLLQLGLKDCFVKQRQWEEARTAWRAALQTNPPEHETWYGYAELCLFLGQLDAYRQAREVMLAKFGTSTDPQVAERTARACLLQPASGDNLRQAVALAGRAADADRSKYGKIYPHFLFVQGLAEYRQGRFDRAASVMRGEASRVLGPAPQLVLAMSQHQSGQANDARNTLALTVLSFDWRAAQVKDQNEWIVHVLRREAETMILPNLAEFLEGKHQPRSSSECMALLGVCQFTNRHRAAASLYADAFAAEPALAGNIRIGLRFNAACHAAQAGCGRGTDGIGLDEPERARWRAQAIQWLRADLAAWRTALDSDPGGTRDLLRQKLASWRTNADLAGLRDGPELDKLSPDERKDWLALWDQVDRLLGPNQPGN